MLIFLLSAINSYFVLGVAVGPQTIGFYVKMSIDISIVLVLFK